MAYLPSSGGEPVPTGQIRDLAQSLGLSIPEEDLEPLSTALRDQLASIERIEALDLDGIGPVLRFDPRWHD